MQPGAKRMLTGALFPMRIRLLPNSHFSGIYFVVVVGPEFTSRQKCEENGEK